MNLILLNNLSAQQDKDFTLTPLGKYTSTDPRLISSGHNGQTLTLDRPPYNGKVDFNNFEEVYKSRPAYDHFEKATYGAFANGQIQYYIDPTLATPFIPEIFSCGSSCYYTPEPYIDPMGSVKPHYNLWLGNKGQAPLQGPVTELTWITDSTAHRESIMASQQARRNQERYDIQKFHQL
jgi:hypothetical protein